MHTLTFYQPGHFHAALLLRSASPRISRTVHVYATTGPDLDRFVALVEGFNNRRDHPTTWDLRLYTEGDGDPGPEQHLLDQLIGQRRGSPVIIAGRNEPKLAAISRLHAAGYAVLVDKPWIVSPAGLPDLRQVTAGPPIVMDLMTGRHDVVNRLCRQIVADRDLFGDFDGDRRGEPDLEFGSIHHLCKRVDDRPLIRPPWCYDVNVQGDGLVDIHSHMVDQAQWLVESRQAGADGHRSNDEPIQIEQAQRWSTPVPLADFVESTGLGRFPDALADRLSGRESSPALNLACNGLIDYRLHGVSVRQRVVWRVRAPSGGSDVHTFTARGTGCTLTVGHDHEQSQARDPEGGPELRLAPVDSRGWPERLARRVESYREVFPGLTAHPAGDGHRLLIPPALATPHEPSFAAVLDEFLDRVESGRWSASSAETVRSRYDLLARAQQLAGQDPA